MAKHIYSLTITFFILFSSTGCSAVEVTDNFLYGIWETRYKLNTDECSNIIGEKLEGIELSCEVKDRTSFHRNNKSTSDGKIEITFTQNDIIIFNETMRYIGSNEWVLYPEESELIVTTGEYDMWLQSNPNEKIFTPKGISESSKIKILDKDTMQSKSLSYGITMTYKRIMNN